MIGPFYVGQVPTDPLHLTIYNDDGTLRDLSQFGSVTLLMWDDGGSPVATNGPGSSVVIGGPGMLTYVWPNATLFANKGVYRYQVQMDNDFSSVGTFDVLAVGDTGITPTLGELLNFWGVEAPSNDADWETRGEMVLQQSSDLLSLVTGVDSIDDPRQLRLVHYAIMDMAILLYVQDPSEAYSPYSSERIGSYSYQLKQKAADGTTGLFWWDRIIESINGGGWNYELLAGSERVFHTGFSRWVRSERLLHQNPLVVPPGAFEVPSLDPSSRASTWQPFGSTEDGAWAGDPYAWPF